MSTSAITSNLLSTELGSSSTANQFATDLNQLAQDLQSGNLSTAQEDYVTLTQDLADAATASSANTPASGITVSLLSDIAGSSSSPGTFTSELNQLGTDLNNDDLSSAQQDMLQLDSTALNAASSATNGATTSAAATASAVAQSQSASLIQSIVQAMGAGDTSAVSTGLTELASVSSSAQGASVLEQLSGTFGSTTSSTGSLSSLLQSLESSSSTNAATSLLG
jgi:hypothetical protein